MSGLEKWLSGITVLAVIATVVSNRNSATVITSLTGGVGNIYKAAAGR